jgi:internalin A
LKHYLAAMKPGSVKHLYGWKLTDQGLELLSGTEIHSLDLRDWGVTDAGLKVVAGLKKLTHLNLRETKVTAEGLKALAGMKLHQLELSEIAKTDLGLKHYLAAIKPYPALNFTGWAITDAGVPELVQLQGLEQLSLTGTHITDMSAPHLTQLKGLQLLWVVDTKMTSSGVALLKKGLPKCSVVGPAP